MARSNLLNTRTTSFGELLGNGRRYRVPLYQRDYSWQEENWEDLWQDILTLLQALPEAAVNHYMGVLVFQPSDHSDRELIIIDGQQRLATLSIFAAAVIAKIQELVDAGQDTEANQERQEILRRIYLGDKNPNSLTYSSKIILNQNNDDFYQASIVNLRKPFYPAVLSQSEKLLWQAFEYFSANLSRLDNPSDSDRPGKSLSSLLTDVVAEKLIFIRVDVEDEFSAYALFETLNARGVELSSTDLLKNYLFSLLCGPDDLYRGQRQWKRIIDTVRMENFPDLLHCHLTLENPRVRRSRLFKTVRSTIKTTQEVFELLDELERKSTLFVAFSNGNDELWRDLPKNRSHIRELELFRCAQAYPLLLVAYSQFSASDFTRLLKLLSTVFFRYSVVGRLNPNAVELLLNQAAVDIKAGKITAPRQVFDAIQELYVPDEKFIQDFSGLRISTKDSKQRQLVKYMLRKLEQDVSQLEVDEESFSIEHILPENPDAAWLEFFTDAQMDNLVYRLGNLTLLEPSLNREIANQPYAVKQQVYQRSVYGLNRAIDDMEAWTPNAVMHRQMQLAKRAAQVWRSDFVP